MENTDYRPKYEFVDGMYQIVNTGIKIRDALRQYKEDNNLEDAKIIGTWDSEDVYSLLCFGKLKVYGQIDIDVEKKNIKKIFSKENGLVNYLESQGIQEGSNLTNVLKLD